MVLTGTDKLTNPHTPTTLADLFEQVFFTDVDTTGTVDATNSARSVVRKTPSGWKRKGRDLEYRLIIEGPGWSSVKARRYQTRDAAEDGRARAIAKYGSGTSAVVYRRQVGPWTAYDGTPANGTEYRVEIHRNGWAPNAKMLRHIDHRALTALLADPRVDRVVILQREIRSGWTPARRQCNNEVAA